MKAISRFAGMAVMAALLLASCAKNEPGLLSTISADTSIVAKVNLNKANIGGLASTVFGNIKVEMDELKEAVDVENVVMTMNYYRFFRMTIVPVKDEGALAKILEANSLTETDNEELEGSKAWEGKDLNVVVKDGIAHFATNKVKVINAEIKYGEKAKTTIADCSGVVKALNADHMVNFSMVTTLCVEDKPTFTVGSIDVADKLTCNFSSIYADGAVAESKVAQLINPDVMKYIPDNAVVAYAFGWNGKELDDNILKTITSQMHQDYAAVASTFWEYLKRLSGTTMIAVTCKPDATIADIDSNPAGTVGVTVMAQMAEDDIRSTLDEIKTIMAVTGLQYSDAGNGLYSCKYGPLTAYFGAMNGYLMLSTSIPQASSSTEGFTLHKNDEAWLQADLMNIGLNSDQKLGLMVSSNYADGKGLLEASFPGSGVPFMESLKKLGVKLGN